MSSKKSLFPGFTSLSDQVFTRAGKAAETVETVETEDQKRRHANDPTVVLLYGWGDGLAKHVAKYADGFRELFPRATQIVILSPISRAMFSDLRQRSNHMMPVLDALSKISNSLENERILVHAMSNAGAINYTATLNSHQQVFGKAMPHQLLVLDSTPGSTAISWSNMVRWARAMARGTTWLPLPFAVTQSIWVVLLYVNSLYAWTIRRDSAGESSAGAWSIRAVNNEKYEVADAARLYMYSKEDELIRWEDVESHVAESRALGRKINTELFDGSGHVGHMRRFPKQYWAAIHSAWQNCID